MQSLINAAKYKNTENFLQASRTGLRICDLIGNFEEFARKYICYLLFNIFDHFS